MTQYYCPMGSLEHHFLCSQQYQSRRSLAIHRIPNLVASSFDKRLESFELLRIWHQIGWNNVPDGRPKPVSLRHLCNDFHATILDGLLSCGCQTGGPNRIDDLASGEIADGNTRRMDKTVSKEFWHSLLTLVCASSISCKIYNMPENSQSMTPRIS